MKFRITILFFFFTALIPFEINARTTSAKVKKERYVMPKIKLIGNHRLTEEAIINIINNNIKGGINEFNINQMLNILYKTNLFRDIKITYENNILTFDLKENKIIRKIEIKGVKDIADKKLKKLLEIDSGSIFNEFLLNDLIKKVAEFHVNSGYYNAVIKKEVIDIDVNYVDILLDIDKGSKPKVAEIKFIGIKNINQKNLDNALLFREKSLLKTFSKKTQYNLGFDEMNAKMMEDFFFNNGYLNFKLLNKEVIFDKEKNTITLIFEVDEGKQFIIEKVTLKSDIPCNKEVMAIINSYVGKPFNKNKSEANINKVKKILRKDNIDAEILMDHKELDDGRIELIYEIKAIPTDYIERIIITGNTRTKDSVIRGQILVHEGDIFNPAAIQSSYRRIFNLGFFEDVDLDYERTPNGKIILMINVIEKKTGEMKIGAGYSSENGLFGEFQYAENNIMGTGNNLGFAIEKGARHFALSGSFYKNNIFDSVIGAGISMAYDDFTNERLHYSNRDASIAVSTGIPLYEDLSLNLRYSLIGNEIYDIQHNASDAIKSQRERTIASKFMYQFVYDKRNIADYPTQGYYVALSQDIAGLGGDKYFASTELLTRYYKTLFYLDDSESANNAVVLQLRNNFGYLRAFNDYLLGVEDRYFLSAVRGFERIQGISPRDNHGKALGGDQYFFGSVQAEFPINLIQDLDFKGHVFLDYGTLILNNKNIFSPILVAENDTQVLSNTELRFAAGVGFSVVTPIAPIGIDLGFPLSHDDKLDRKKVIYFTMSRQM